MTKISFIERQMISFLNTGFDAINNVIHDKEIDISGRIPSFFYKLPIFIKQTNMRDANVSDNISIRTSQKLDNKHLEMLEFILLKATLNKGVLSANIPVDAMIKEFNIDYDYFLEELCNTNLIIKESNGDYSNIGFVSEFKIVKERVKILLSPTTLFLYHVDYLMPYNKHKDLLKLFSNNKTKIFIRMALSMPIALGKGVKIETLERRGFSWSYEDQAEIINDLRGRKEDLALSGLILNTTSGTNSGLLYDKSKYIGLKTPYVDIEKLDSLEGENKATTPVDKHKIICFKTLQMNDMLFNKAIALGVQKDQINHLFKNFKGTYASSGEEHTKLLTLWSSFLKKNAYFAKEKKNTPNEIKTPKTNAGAAENIILDDKMKSIATTYGIPQQNLNIEFIQFKNYYIGTGRKAANWYSFWENWVIRGQSKKTNAFEQKTHLENEFYLHRLVSNDIKLMLQKNGVSPTEVVRGEVEVPDIVFANFPIPPRMGRGEETLFSFKDIRLQEEAKSRYSKPTENTPVIDILIQEDSSHVG